MHRFLALALLVISASSALAAPRDDLLDAEQAFSATAAARGHEAAYLAYLAEDAADFGAGAMKPIYGIEAFRASVRSGASANPPGSLLSWTPEHARVSGDGSLGAVDGVWTYLGPPAEPRVKLTGHYLRVWKRGADGAWKIEADMATNDPVR